MRPGARLGMTLETEGGAIGPRQALEGTVEQRHMRRAQVVFDASGIDREAVVLARDDHLTGIEILHRMVRSMVAELHLERLRAGGEAHQLVSEADAEHRDLGG